MKQPAKHDTAHPDRDEILKALKAGDGQIKGHLERCESCRSVYNLLILDEHLGLLDNSTPSERASFQHANLPLAASNWIPRRAEIGISEHDSWKGLPTTVTRDSAMGLERSLRFTSGPISLEVVADRTPEGWYFAARCYRGSAPSGEFILKVGRIRIVPGLHDCYTWSAPHPPRTIQLLSPSTRLLFDTGSW